MCQQKSLDQLVDSQMMAKYKAKQLADDHETMDNAAKMNAKWGGSFRNGVGSNTWAGTPWGKYDDAVKTRRKQMLVQMAAPKGGLGDEEEDMEKYDASHPDPAAARSKFDKDEDVVHSQLAKAGESSLMVDDAAVRGDMVADPHNHDLRDPEPGVKLPEGQVFHGPTSQDDMMTDSDEGELEDQKPQKLSLQDSIKDCESSCNKDTGCIHACKTVMDPVPVETHKKHAVSRLKWQVEKESSIKNCMKACTTVSCKASCTDPMMIKAPEPTASSFEEEPVSDQQAHMMNEDSRTEDLYQVPAHVIQSARARVLAKKSEVMKHKHLKGKSKHSLPSCPLSASPCTLLSPPLPPSSSPPCLLSFPPPPLLPFLYLSSPSPVPNFMYLLHSLLPVCSLTLFVSHAHPRLDTPYLATPSSVLPLCLRLSCASQTAHAIPCNTSVSFLCQVPSVWCEEADFHSESA